MACPFFQPGLRLDDAGRWTHAPRMPLGEACHGTCHARPAELFEPAEDSLLELCNWGYARGRCERFPPDAPADAVRFSIAAAEPEVLRLIYVLERDHAPAEHGAIDYSIALRIFSPSDASALLVSQASMFIESYLRRAPH